MPQVGEMSAFKLIHYFSSQLPAFGCWASLQPDNVTVNPANERMDQRFPDLKCGFGAAAHATLDRATYLSYQICFC